MTNTNASPLSEVKRVGVESFFISEPESHTFFSDSKSQPHSTKTSLYDTPVSCRAAQHKRWEVGEHCLSTKRELRSRPLVRAAQGTPKGQRAGGCRDTVSEAWGAGAAAMAPRFTMFLAAACAPSRSTLRESESGAPFSLVTFFWRRKRKSPAAGLPPAFFSHPLT